MEKKKTISIYLEDEDYEFIKKLSEESGINMALAAKSCIFYQLQINNDSIFAAIAVNLAEIAKKMSKKRKKK